jgi:hypothetical protein
MSYEIVATSGMRKGYAHCTWIRPLPADSPLVLRHIDLGFATDLYLLVKGEMHSHTTHFENDSVP